MGKAQNYMYHLWIINSGKYTKILVILFSGIVNDFLQLACVFIIGKKEKTVPLPWWGSFSYVGAGGLGSVCQIASKIT